MEPNLLFFPYESEFEFDENYSLYPLGLPHSKIAVKMYEDSVRAIQSNAVANNLMNELLENRRSDDYYNWMDNKVSKYTACSNVIANEISNLYKRDDLDFEDWHYLVLYKKFSRILTERGHCSEETITSLIYNLVNLIRNDLNLRNLLILSSDDYVEVLLTRFVEMAMNEKIYDYEYSRPHMDECKMKAIRKHLQRSTRAASKAHSVSKLWGWMEQDQVVPPPTPISAPSRLNPENYFVYGRQLKESQTEDGHGINIRDGCIPVPRVVFPYGEMPAPAPRPPKPTKNSEPKSTNPEEQEKKNSKRYGPRGPYKRTIIRMRMREISRKRRIFKKDGDQENTTEEETDGQNDSNDSTREELEVSGVSQLTDSTLVDELDLSQNDELNSSKKDKDKNITENTDITNVDYKTSDKNKNKEKEKEKDKRNESLTNLSSNMEDPALTVIDVEQNKQKHKDKENDTEPVDNVSIERMETRSTKKQQARLRNMRLRSSRTAPVEINTINDLMEEAESFVEVLNKSNKDKVVDLSKPVETLYSVCSSDDFLPEKKNAVDVDKDDVGSDSTLVDEQDLNRNDELNLSDKNQEKEKERNGTGSIDLNGDLDLYNAKQVDKNRDKNKEQEKSKEKDKKKEKEKDNKDTRKDKDSTRLEETVEPRLTPDKPDQLDKQQGKEKVKQIRIVLDKNRDKNKDQEKDKGDKNNTDRVEKEKERRLGVEDNQEKNKEKEKEKEKLDKQINKDKENDTEKEDENEAINLSPKRSSSSVSKVKTEPTPECADAYGRPTTSPRQSPRIRNRARASPKKEPYDMDSEAASPYDFTMFNSPFGNRFDPYPGFKSNYLNHLPEAQVQKNLLGSHMMDHTTRTPKTLGASTVARDFETITDLYRQLNLEYGGNYKCNLSSDPSSDEYSSPNLIIGMNRDFGGNGAGPGTGVPSNVDMGLFEDVLECNLVYYKGDQDVSFEMDQSECESSPLKKFKSDDPFHSKPIPDNLNGTSRRRSSRLKKVNGFNSEDELEMNDSRNGDNRDLEKDKDECLEQELEKRKQNKDKETNGTGSIDLNGDLDLYNTKQVNKEKPQEKSKEQNNEKENKEDKRKGDDTIWDMVQKHQKSGSGAGFNVAKPVNNTNREVPEDKDDMSLLIREHYHVSENVPSSQTQPYVNAYKTPKSIKWSYTDTKRFYNAIETFGTDLLLVRAYLPEYTDRQVYDKFKLEERKNPQLMQNALQTHKSISLKQYEQKHGKIDTNTHYNPLKDPLLQEETYSTKNSLKLNINSSSGITTESHQKVDDKIINLFM